MRDVGYILGRQITCYPHWIHSNKNITYDKDNIPNTLTFLPTLVTDQFPTLATHLNSIFSKLLVTFRISSVPSFSIRVLGSATSCCPFCCHDNVILSDSRHSQLVLQGKETVSPSDEAVYTLSSNIDGSGYASSPDQLFSA